MINFSNLYTRKLSSTELNSDNFFLSKTCQMNDGKDFYDKIVAICELNTRKCIIFVDQTGHDFPALTQSRFRIFVTIKNNILFTVFYHLYSGNLLPLFFSLIFLRANKLETRNRSQNNFHQFSIHSVLPSSTDSSPRALLSVHSNFSNLKKYRQNFEFNLNQNVVIQSMNIILIDEFIFN